jgi:hypothetical protein
MTDKLIHAEIDIKELESMANSIKGLHASGKINQEQSRRLMFAIMAGDSRGNLWTIGTQTGKWYKQAGNKWLEGQPPKKLLLVIPEDDYKKAAAQLEDLKFEMDTKISRTNKCPNCMAVSDSGDIFCSKCGTSLTKTGQQEPKPSAIIDKCPGCGQVLTGKLNYCIKCGRKINY